MKRYSGWPLNKLVRPTRVFKKRNLVSVKISVTVPFKVVKYNQIIIQKQSIFNIVYQTVGIGYRRGWWSIYIDPIRIFGDFSITVTQRLSIYDVCNSGHSSGIRPDAIYKTIPHPWRLRSFLNNK